MQDGAEAPPVRTLAAGETPVYEDSVSSGSRVERAVPAAQPELNGIAMTLTVDSEVDPGGRVSLLQTVQTSAASPSAGGSSVTMTSRTASTDIVLERVLGPDGVMRMVMRQRR